MFGICYRTDLETCEICNLRISGGPNFAQHLKGVKHTKAAAAAAFAAVTEALATADPSGEADASTRRVKATQVTYVGPEANYRDYCTQVRFDSSIPPGV